MIKTSFKNAVKYKCFDCAYDPKGEGINAIYKCESKSCALSAFRPGAKLTPDLNQNYVGFDPDNSHDLRGQWVETELSHEEKLRLETRREIGRERMAKLHAAKKEKK